MCDVPCGLTRIDTVGDHRDQNISLMGVVVDFMPPAPTKGTDWVCTFSIGDLFSRSAGQRVRFFAHQQDLPSLQGPGDVILLKNIKLKEYRGSDVLLSNRSTEWTVFERSSILKTRPAGAVKLNCMRSRSACMPSASEMGYAIELSNSTNYDFSSERDPGVQQLIPATSSSAGKVSKDKSSLIRDIKTGTFYDLTGQVVKIYASNDRLDLYITDFTSNELLYNYEQPCDGAKQESTDVDRHEDFSAKKKRNWSGPYGKQTLMVTLFSPHCYYARQKLVDGQHVLLRNVHIRLGKDASSCKLEGALHGDRKYPDQINVEVLDSADCPSDCLKALLRRKKEYERHLKLIPRRENSGLKRSSSEVDSIKMSRTTQKRKKARISTKNKESIISGLTTEAERGCPEGPPPAASCMAFNELQKHISCVKPDQPTRNISAILSMDTTHSYTTPNGTPCTLPFQNLASRAMLRVVDFKPQNLEDFAVLQRVSEFDVLSDTESEADDEIDRSTACASERNDFQVNGSDKFSGEDNVDNDQHKWTWQFALLLEDARGAKHKRPAEQLIAYVAGKDAEYLLQMDPTDLRRDRQTLAQLREKLFILWGDLEECKIQNVENAREFQVLKARNKDQRALTEKTVNPRTQKDAVGEICGSAEDKSVEVVMQAGGKYVERKPSTTAFSCCIKEYGIKLRGKWERRFRLSGTTII